MRQYEMKHMVCRDLMLEAELEKRAQEEAASEEQAKKRDMRNFIILAPILFFGMLGLYVLFS